MFPEKVMKLINTIFRTFFWIEGVSVSKKDNILHMELWNMAAILEQLWDMAKKKDCMRIQWVPSY